MDVEGAYRACLSITRRRAANFYYGIRLLPPAKRRALSAVYAFARRVDDIGDGPGAAAARHEAGLRELERQRRLVCDPGASTGLADPVIVAVADAVRRFALPVEAFGDLIDGVEMDLRGAEYDTFDELVVYCRRVAGSIGRLSVGVFGATDGALASRRADDLGVAMQLTNIVRDVREDRRLGRRYLPVEDLRRAGCTDDDLAAGAPPAAAVVLAEAERARQWFDRGLRLMPLLDRRSAACVGAMTGIYRRLLSRIERSPEAVFAGRVSVPAWEKAYVAAASLAGRGVPARTGVGVPA
jgi:phytoene synthase